VKPWNVTIYRDHRAMGDVHGLSRREASKLVSQLNGAETWPQQGGPILAGRLYRD
jgi:hypothetical protein